MADNTNRWRQDAARIASRSPSSVPTYKAPPPYQQREVTQAEVNRIRRDPPATGNKGKRS